MSPKTIILALLLALGICAGGVFMILRGTSGIPGSSITRLSVMTILRAASEFAEKNGRYPDSLGELQGAAREDLRDAWDQPIRYELRGDGLLILTSVGEDGADTRFCAATRRADGTLALTGPDGMALAFLRSSEVTVYEFARLAEAFDRAEPSVGAEAAARGLLSRGPVLDGWGTPIRVEWAAGSIEFVSLGGDREPGYPSDSELPLRHVDRYAERELEGETASPWVYYRGDVDGAEEREPLFELDRRLR